MKNLLLVLTLAIGSYNSPTQVVYTAQDVRDMLSVNDYVNLNGALVLSDGKPIDIDGTKTLECFDYERICTSVTQTTAAVPAGSFSFDVVDASIYKPLDWVLRVNSSLYLDNSGGQINSIQSIVGNTITLFQATFNAMPLGADVISQHPLIRVNGTASIRFVNFKGNRGCNNYTNDWRYNRTLNMKSGDVVEYCTFKEIPNENIFYCGGELRYNRAEGLDGSFVHGSCSNGAFISGSIHDNYVDGVCEDSVIENGHNEGGFTYSNAVIGFNFFNNVFKNGGEGAYGNQGFDDFNNNYYGNYFENFKSRITTAGGHPNPDDISQDNFVNVPE